MPSVRVVGALMVAGVATLVESCDEGPRTGPPAELLPGLAKLGAVQTLQLDYERLSPGHAGRPSRAGCTGSTDAMGSLLVDVRGLPRVAFLAPNLHIAWGHQAYLKLQGRPVSPAMAERVDALWSEAQAGLGNTRFVPRPEWKGVGMGTHPLLPYDPDDRLRVWEVQPPSAPWPDSVHLAVTYDHLSHDVVTLALVDDTGAQAEVDGWGGLRLSLPKDLPAHSRPVDPAYLGESVAYDHRRGEWDCPANRPERPYEEQQRRVDWVLASEGADVRRVHGQPTLTCTGETQAADYTTRFVPPLDGAARAIAGSDCDPWLAYDLKTHLSVPEGAIGCVATDVVVEHQGGEVARRALMKCSGHDELRVAASRRAHVELPLEELGVGLASVDELSVRVDTRVELTCSPSARGQTARLQVAFEEKPDGFGGRPLGRWPIPSEGFDAPPHIGWQCDGGGYPRATLSPRDWVDRVRTLKNEASSK